MSKTAFNIVSWKVQYYVSTIIQTFIIALHTLYEIIINNNTKHNSNYILNWFGMPYLNINSIVIYNVLLAYCNLLYKTTLIEIWIK